MSANVAGAGNAGPNVFVETQTISRGASVPGGVRTAVILGEGSRSETLVSSAVGGGNDGFNSTYSSTSVGRDGRHFKTSFYPLISNRTTVYKNGIPLEGIEQVFTSTSGAFSSRYDYRLDITTGRIELQTASLVDQGGAYYKKNSLNTGTGTIGGLSLLDLDAPTETWDIRCVSVRRDGNGDPIDGYAKFVAKGSISGTVLDGYGNQVIWYSDNQIKDNGILQFYIEEGGTNFKEGDRFTIKVKGGTLSKGDSLSVTYIAETDLNDPEFFTDLQSLAAKHGQPSLTNRLSLGAQLAFANNPPGVWTCQTKPAIPRRISYQVESSASGGTTADDLQFPLPLNVIPDANSKIHFFVTDAATNTETEIIPNKIDFYDADYTASPSLFNFGPTTFSYTVVLEDAVIKNVEDGEITYVGPTTGTLSSETRPFDSGDVDKTVRILEPNGNAGDYTVVSVADGIATITGATFVNATDVNWEVIDDTLTGAKILFSSDLALAAGSSLRVTVVDQKDAEFFDAGWELALESIERIETDIVVPLPTQTISAIFQTTLAHCRTMSSIPNDKERVCIIGAIRGLTPDHILGNKDAAVEDIGILEGIQGDDISEILAGDIEDLANYKLSDSFGTSFRSSYMYPDEIVVQVGSSREKLDGFYMAPALAGWYSGVSNIAIPATNKTITGFTILRDKEYRPIIQNNLMAEGVTLVQPVSGGGLIKWGRTTTQSGFAVEEEASVIFIRDRCAKIARQAFKVFIGLPDDGTLIGSMLGTLNNLGIAFTSQKLITKFRDPKVVRNAAEPRQYDAELAIFPTLGVDWVYIRLGIDT